MTAGKAIYQLTDVKQAHGVILALWERMKPVLAAGKQLQIEVKAQRKSRPQEEMYHALIGQIATQAQHMGAKWDAESWKRFLIDQWAHETGRSLGKVMPSLDGERVVQLGIQSRKFSKEESIEFIDWLMAWGNLHGVDLK